METNLHIPTQATIPAGPHYEPFPPEAIEGSVPQRFEAIAQRAPDRLAVADDAQRLTYDQLNRQANRLAYAILERLGPGSEPVGILLPHNSRAIVGILAILKAGKIYLPLGPGETDERLTRRVLDAGARLVLCNRAWIDRCSRLADGKIEALSVDDLGAGINESNPQIDLRADAGLNLMYTSGSSGQPKGVLQTHRNALHLVSLLTDIQKDSPEDRFSLIIPITFGASAADIFGALLVGASLHLFDIKKQGVHRLVDWLASQEITIYHSVPTIYRQMLNTLEQPGRLPHLRCIKLGGEPLVRRDIDLFQRYFSPQCVLQHALGTTETYLSACWMIDQKTTIREAVVPIGYPTAGTRIHLLDDAGQPVPPGEIGRIAIHSRYLSPGYWNQPELTQAAFLPDPEDKQARIYLSGDLGRINPDGQLEYLGRQDDMVKINGQRVEPAAVELALLEIDEISEAAVTAFTPADGQTRLAAYLVPGSQPPPEAGEIRRLLARKLPAAMIPASITFLEQLPLLPFGKVNRQALPPPAWGASAPQTAYLAPETPGQARLAQIFAEVLGRRGGQPKTEIGLLENYFDLGGDSLAAVEISLHIEETFQVQVNMQDLIEHPTVAELASYIDSLASGGRAPQPEEDLQRSLRLLGY